MSDEYIDAAQRSGGDKIEVVTPLWRFDATKKTKSHMGCLVLESAPAATAWHTVVDEGDAVRDIATVIGRRLRLPVEPVPEDAFGPLGPIFVMDQPASSAHTREALGWRPAHRSVLEDLESLQP